MQSILVWLATTGLMIDHIQDSRFEHLGSHRIIEGGADQTLHLPGDPSAGFIQSFLFRLGADTKNKCRCTDGRSQRIRGKGIWQPSVALIFRALPRVQSDGLGHGGMMDVQSRSEHGR